MGTTTTRWTSTALLLALALSGPTGCGSEAGDDAAAVEAAMDSATRTYVAIAAAAFTDTQRDAAALQAACETFVAAPTAGNLAAARAAWKMARESYLQTEVFRFYDGPIELVEGWLNAWPLDEAYVDYVDGNPTAGLINDTSTPITAAKLAELNAFGGDANIATGYHAIEFLLWGQDHSATGPGDRPHTDYLTSGGTAAHQDRRGSYLTVTAKLLASHLQQAQVGYDADADSWAAEWLTAPAKKRLRDALTGMFLLAGFETGGERLQAAYDSGDQEDEHSCFSDNTHRDMVQDVRGIRNVWVGSYLRTDGTTVQGDGIRVAVQAQSPTLAARLDAEIDAALAATEALQPPFDREIAKDNPAGRARVKAAIDALQKVEATIAEVFGTFGLDIPQPE
ncbi:MAG: iron-regulated protein [Deltaproteobacteria bacterium]|nr:iron-regulated protein [Deltaproteobacteria bacterium]